MVGVGYDKESPLTSTREAVTRLNYVMVKRWIAPVFYISLYTLSHIYLIANPQDKNKANYFAKEERYKTQCIHQMNGYEGPTCGLTTSYRFFIEGRIVDSFVRQPFGMVSALVALGLFIIMLLVMVKGESYYVKGLTLVRKTHLMKVILLLFLAGWVYNFIRHLILHS